VRSLPIGWTVTLSRAEHHGSRIHFSGRDRTVTLAFTPTCAPGLSRASRQRLDVPDENALLTTLASSASRTEFQSTLDGACASVTVASNNAAYRSPAAINRDLQRLVRWVPRVFLDAFLEVSTRGRAHRV
jgi:hypothetical protein